MNDGDGGIRQFDARVQRSDCRVVPLLDLAHEDLGDGWTVQLQLAAFDAFDVDDRHDTADHARKLTQTAGLQVFCGHRSIGCTEVNGRSLDLGNTTTRTDGLIVDTVILALAVVLGPRRNNRVDETRTSACYISRVSHTAKAQRCDQKRQAFFSQQNHGNTSVQEIVWWST